MQTAFLQGLGNKLIEQWAATLLTPAFVFWLGVLVAWLQTHSWQALEAWFSKLVEPLQIAVLLGSLLVIAASAFVVQRFDLAVLRFFEGYWPAWMKPLKRRLLAQQQRRFAILDQRWQVLQVKQAQTGLTAEELEELIALEGQFRGLPSQPERLMPMKLGNLLRAAESRPGEKYGLDAIICWPRLWLVLPSEVKQELQTARADLNTAARIWLWGILFCGWVGLQVWWAIPLGGLTAWFAHHWMLGAAAIYGDLLESAFDLHRFDLYRSLHWTLPTHPAEERQLGQQLTQYLWRGSDRPHPTFV